MEIREITQKLKNTLPPAERDALIKENRKKDDKLMKGMFEFIDAQGGFLEFAYRKYPGETSKIIKIMHGEICELPMGIVKHLNNTKKKVRRYDLSIPFEGGRPMRTFETISRCRFTPMDVM